MDCSPSTASGGRPPQLSQDGAIVLALAGTAMSFATSFHEEAERWLRLLRMHGEVGAALQALGVGEVPLEAASSESAAAISRSGGGDASATVELVSLRACAFASASGSPTIGTVHILFSVVSIYGPAFDRELYRRGGSRDELFERLAGVGAERTSGSAL